MNIDNVIKLINRALSSRMEVPEIDWNSGDIRRLFVEMSRNKTVKAFSDEDLGSEFERTYFFVFVNEKNSSTILKDVFNAIEVVIEKSDGIKDRIMEERKASFFVIVKDLETKINIEMNWGSVEYCIKDKYGIKKRFKSEPVFIFDNDNRETTFEISHIDRYSVIQEPELEKITLSDEGEETNLSRQVGYVTTINLEELVNLYNKLGDRLFDDNVRYAIDEQLGVDRAIKDTLENNPDQFWFRNNGVTILVKSKEFFLNYPNKIVLHMNKSDSFSVINGAQTISVASSFIFTKKAECKAIKEKLERDNLSEEEKKTEEENLIKLKGIVNSFKNVRLLLRIIYIDNSKDKVDIKEARNISVALNRQKPIKQEDIAYTSDYVNVLCRYLDELNGSELHFNIIKRGENALVPIDLSELSKIRLACKDKPLNARNSSVSTSLKLAWGKENELVFSDTNIFPSIENMDDFKRYYSPVRFMHHLAELYNVNISEFKDFYKEDLERDPDNKEINDKITLITNARWFMLSQLIIFMNGNNVDDYTRFDSKYPDMLTINAEQFYKMMDSYFDQYVALLDGTPIDTKFFKNDDWYRLHLDNIDMEEVIKAGLSSETE